MDTSLTDEEKEFLLNGTNLVDVDDDDEDNDEDDDEYEYNEEEGMTFRLLLKDISGEDYSEIVTFLDSLGVDYEEL